MTESYDGLTLRNVTVHFSGIVAVHDLSLNAQNARITGLIGPNGAGKTTTFNACCGVVPSDGVISLDGRELTRLGPAGRARAGLGRTFQRIELCDGLTVYENVSLGPESLSAGWQPWTQVFGSIRDRARIRDRALTAIDRCGLVDLADVSCGQLSTGQRRFVEMARAIASGFRFLLLDEPSSGLDAHETERFGTLLRSLVADCGTGILLVEHDMTLVRQVCQYTWVLEFGELIASGPTTAVLSSDEVRSAYLGTADRLADA